MVWGSAGGFLALINIQPAVVDIQLSTSQYQRVSYSMATGAWVHFAFGKSAGSPYLYIGGTAQSLSTSAAGDPGSGSVGVSIGALPGAYY
jgi:hypothetical protein